MRKLKLQVQISVDGFVAGPNGEMDWVVWDWDEELKKYVGDMTNPVDTILLGRKMTDGFVKHWAAAAADLSAPEHEAGKKFTETAKVVFSKSLKVSTWENTVVATGNIVDEVNILKQKRGGDIIVYGGASFVSDLIKHDLIDEYNLFVNPAAIGKGLSIFAGIEKSMQLSLSSARQFDCGIVVYQYKKI